MRKLLLLIVATMSLTTFAQKKPEPRQPTKELIFGEDDDLIEGRLNQPDGELFTGRGGAKHASLLKVRENFRDKVMASASAL